MRYARQEALLGSKAHAKLRKATVAVVGLGGIGCTSALLCTQLGVKRLIVADFDVVDETNLSRQALFTAESIGKQKASEAKKSLEKINPGVEVEAFNQLITEKNAATILADADVVLDCTDSYKSKMTINKWSVQNGKPMVYAGAVGFEAMVSTILPRKTACLECIAGKSNAAIMDCAGAGVINTATSLAATLQVNEMVGLLCFRTPNYAGKLFYVDLRNGLFHEKNLKKRKNCTVCSKA